MDDFFGWLGVCWFLWFAWLISWVWVVCFLLWLVLVWLVLVGSRWDSVEHFQRFSFGADSLEESTDWFRGSW